MKDRIARHGGRLLCVALLSLLSLEAGAHRLKDLDINVLLDENGDAHITEVRRMTIDDSGTECYIVLANLGGRKVGNIKVSDESNTEFEGLPRWNIDWSRSKKTHSWGLVSRSDGYELCWGLGEAGERTYTVEYTLEGLVTAYDDADGFNYRFVPLDLEPSPEHVRVVIERADGRFRESDTRIWAFNFEGEINIISGEVVAETTKSMTKDNAVTIMVLTDKGMFSPWHTEDKTSEEVEEEAIKGSDYKNSLSLMDILVYAALLLIPVFLIGLILYSVVSQWQSKRKATKDLTWWREPPYMGNLHRANSVLNAHRFSKPQYKGLVTASVLRLLSIGALRIENHYVAPGGLGRMLGRDGKVVPCFAIGELRTVKGLANYRLLNMLYQFFVAAAGDDRILQPNELKQWMNRNTGEMERFYRLATERLSIKEVNKDMENVRKVYGLRKFLKEFTLANERHLQELSLWKEYLVWAELFGISKQVRKDMMSINPEIGKMDSMFRDMMDDDVVDQFAAATLYGVGRAHDAIRSRESGGGGSSSLGGGGGFSGASSGGGVR